MDNEKAKSKSVSLAPSLWDDVEKYAYAKYGGNRSQYIKELIENDLKNKPTKLPPKEDESFFVDLCGLLAGHTAEARAKKAFEGLKSRVGQREFLEHVLRRAAIAALWLSAHPDALYDGIRFQHHNEFSEHYEPPLGKSIGSTQSKGHNSSSSPSIISLSPELISKVS